VPRRHRLSPRRRRQTLTNKRQQVPAAPGSDRFQQSPVWGPSDTCWLAGFSTRPRSE
jgi:hypothetical protein